MGGSDIYWITASIVVAAGTTLIASGPAGVLSPREAFEARDLLGSLEPHGIEVQPVTEEQVAFTRSRAPPRRPLPLRYLDTTPLTGAARHPPDGSLVIPL